MVKGKRLNWLIIVIMILLAVVFLAPIFIVLINAFKGQFFISDQPFAMLTQQTNVGMKNYVNGVEKIGFFTSFGYSLLITIPSVLVIVVFTSMTAWYITRVKSKGTKILYYMIVFSMVVPFQMVMFTMSKVANILRLDNPTGIILIYLGFGAGLSVFMFAGFVKSIPLEIEESATIDGCNPLQLFAWIVFPVLKPISVTVAILNTMWIWNDYLLPYLVIGSKYRTIPIAVQYLQGGYGSKDMGASMAMLILAIIPIIIFYLFCQKYIIRGVVAGAVKG
ncbi:MAG: carbohydrate ABC transporter permease [Clostridiales bacterium]|nr:carbohydrate ABC transporter permease [Clostridiales bacterium]